MPEELTEAQEAELVADLKRLTTALEQALRSSVESSQTVELDQPIGRLSRMDAMQQQKMAAAARDRQKQRMAAVRSALTRATEGDYGLCRSCDDDIGFPRLKARPETGLCLTCASQLEASRRR